MGVHETIDIDRDERPFRSGIKLLAGWLAGGLVIVLAVVLAGLLATRHAPPASLAAVHSITAFGTLVLDDPGAGFDTTDAPSARKACAGSGAFADVGPGAAITVTAGTSIARTGKVVGGLAYDSMCHFTWAVAQVPAGYGHYQISMAGRGMVDVTEAALAAEIPLWISPPDGQLTAVRPPTAPTNIWEMLTLFGTLILIDSSGPFVPMARCTGTGRNADIGPTTQLVLSLDGATVVTNGLAGGFASDAQTCRFAFFMTPSTPLQQRPYTLTIAAHGSVQVQPQPFGYGTVLILNESGQLIACDNNTSQC